jgi:hypothetical protein
MFAGAGPKSEARGTALMQAAEAAGVASFDAGAAVGSVQGIDGLHLSRAQHVQLGKAMAAAGRAL